MTIKPLPDAIISFLRGEAAGGEGPIFEVAEIYYRDGLEGEPYQEIDATPPFPADMVEIFERFLRACYEQGRKDAK